MINTNILRLLLFLAGYMIFDEIQLANGYDSPPKVNCGCHIAESCAQCGTLDMCNGDCVWKGYKCVSKYEKEKCSCAEIENKLAKLEKGVDSILKKMTAVPCTSTPTPDMTLVVTGGDPSTSATISSGGVCSSPNIPLLQNATTGGKSFWTNDGTLMFCGGSQTYISGDATSEDWGATDICWKLRPGDTEWKSETKSNMNVNRSWFSLNSINAEEAVAAGGLDNNGTIWDTLEKYSAGEWKVMDIKLDNPTYGHCAVQYTTGGNSYLMIIGGSQTFNQYWNVSASVTQIDLSTGYKVSVDAGPLPALWAPACTIHGEDIYVSGGGKRFGEDGWNPTTGVYRFNLKEGQFTFQGNLNTPRWGATMGVTADGQLVVAGGWNLNGTIGTSYRTIEDFYLLAEIESSDDGGATWNTWTTELPHGVQYASMASVPARTFKCQKSLVHCPIGWTALQTGCYKFAEASTFEEARTRCNETGGFIAEIKSQSEQDAVSQFMKDSTVISAMGVWLGATIVDVYWTWVHSEEHITFNAWASGQPSIGTSEPCLAAWKHFSWKWNNIACDQHANQALCQYPPYSVTW